MISSIFSRRENTTRSQAVARIADRSASQQTKVNSKRLLLINSISSCFLDIVL